MKRLSIAIVGPGRLGTALALHLKQSGYNIAEVVSRDSRSLPIARRLAQKVAARASQTGAARLDADLIWFCMPDSNIPEVATKFAGGEWKSKIAFHSSGVLTSDALQSLRDRGASTASVHPLMTFIPGSVPELSGVTFAAEGDAAALRTARRIVRDLGGEMVRLRKQDKVAYHAFATMICPLLVALLASAERAAGLAGISRKQARRRMLPIIEETLHNYARVGPEKAFTGPFVRGDLETIKVHLKAMARIPAVRDVYTKLATAALEYLPTRNRRQIGALLRKSK